MTDLEYPSFLPSQLGASRANKQHPYGKTDWPRGLKKRANREIGVPGTTERLSLAPELYGIPFPPTGVTHNFLNIIGQYSFNNVVTIPIPNRIPERSKVLQAVRSS